MLNRTDPQVLNDVLKELITKFGWQEKFDLSYMMNNWTEIMGSKFAEVTKPTKLKDAVLTVETNSSVWRTELFYRREQIIEKINTIIGKIAVKELIIR